MTAGRGSPLPRRCPPLTLRPLCLLLLPSQPPTRSLAAHSLPTATPNSIDPPRCTGTPDALPDSSSPLHSPTPLLSEPSLSLALRRRRDELRRPQQPRPPPRRGRRRAAGGNAPISHSVCRCRGRGPAAIRCRSRRIESPSAGVQPLPEQMRKKQRRSAPFCRSLDRLATVELQLILQCLDKRSKLRSARCSRQLLQAADHPFAWQGPSVAVSSFRQPQLGSLIRRSLLRHAPIKMDLNSDLPVPEVAAIPRLRELSISHRCSADLALHLLQLPSLQGLQTLRVVTSFPESALQLLPSLPALHTLQCCDPETDEPVDWRWLPALPALTALDLSFSSRPSDTQTIARRHRPVRSVAVVVALPSNLANRHLCAPLLHPFHAPAAPPRTHVVHGRGECRVVPTRGGRMHRSFHCPRAA